MRLEILRAVVEEMRCKFPKNPVWDINEEPKWRERFAVQSKFLSVPELEMLANVYERDENKEKIEDRRTARKLRALAKLGTSGSTLKIRNLESMVEAMKMEVEVKAATSGTVSSIAVEAGAQVTAGEAMASIN